MKQKVVIKVSMNGQKSQSKALKIVVRAAGVESVALQGKDKDQIEIIGEGVDAVVLTTLLRKKMGSAELVSVSAVGEKKEEKKDNPGNKNEPTEREMVWPPLIVHYPSIPDRCSIM